MVAITSSHAGRSPSSRTTRRRAAMLGHKLVRKPRTILTHSDRKKISSATAVATCRATINAR